MNCFHVVPFIMVLLAVMVCFYLLMLLLFESFTMEALVSYVFHLILFVTNTLSL